MISIERIEFTEAPEHVPNAVDADVACVSHPSPGVGTSPAEIVVGAGILAPPSQDEFLTLYRHAIVSPVIKSSSVYVSEESSRQLDFQLQLPNQLNFYYIEV